MLFLSSWIGISDTSCQDWGRRNTKLGAKVWGRVEWDWMSDLGVWQEAELGQGGWRGLESEARAAPQEMSNLSSVCKLEFRVRFKGKQSLLGRQDQISGQILGQLEKKWLLGDWRPARPRPSSISPFLEFLPPLVLKAQTTKTGICSRLRCWHPWCNQKMSTACSLPCWAWVNWLPQPPSLGWGRMH